MTRAGACGLGSRQLLTPSLPEAYLFRMLRPACRGLLYGLPDTALQRSLEEAGCVVAVAQTEAEAAELKATFRPEVIFGHRLAAGMAGRLHRLPPKLDALYCLLVEPHDLPTTSVAPEYDELIVLPLRPAELEVRLRLWRWRREQLHSSGVLRAGSLVVDLVNLRVTVGGAPVALTYKEYELLCLLMRRRGHVVTREQILDLVWGPDYYGGSRTVDVHVRRLRMKIPEISDQITTVHGAGYRFEEQQAES